MANINKVALLNNGKVVGAGRNKDNSNLAPIEATTTASRSYLVGDYLMLQGEFYKVIQAISIGNALVVGTNIQATSVGGEIVNVNNKIKWNHLGQYTGGSSISVSLPNEYNELLIDINVSSVGIATTIHILKDCLSSTARSFDSGYYNTSTDYAIFLLALTNTTISRCFARHKGSDVASVFNVYYR